MSDDCGCDTMDANTSESFGSKPFGTEEKLWLEELVSSLILRYTDAFLSIFEFFLQGCRDFPGRLLCCHFHPIS